MDDKNIIEPQTLMVVEEEEISLGSEDEKVEEKEDSAKTYQLKPGELTYRVLQVGSNSQSNDSSSGIPQIIMNTIPSAQSSNQTIFNNSLSGQVFVIGSNPNLFSKSIRQKPIAPRIGPTIERPIEKHISKKDERRRATHNEVERRRRDKINNWITKLGNLLPNCESDNSKNCESQSKGGILAKACDYIIDLRGKKSNEGDSCLQLENKKLREELTKSKLENEKLIAENRTMKALLQSNGLSLKFEIDGE